MGTVISQISIRAMVGRWLIDESPTVPELDG